MAAKNAAPRRPVGRPRKPEAERLVQCTIQMPPELLEYLDRYPGKSRNEKVQFILRAIQGMDLFGTNATENQASI